jgi:hypothetical protein
MEIRLQMKIRQYFGSQNQLMESGIIFGERNNIFLGVKKVKKERFWCFDHMFHV